MRPLRDPAPSRLAYRLNRLMLTPGFRRILRFGLPVFLIAAGVAFWASEPKRREATAVRLVEFRHEIEARPEFLVHMMEIDDASEDVATEIRARFPIDYPISSFDLDLEDIRVEIESLDAIASASVYIRSGGVLSVEVRERVPVLIWRNENKLTLLDADGHRVASINARFDRNDLPLVVGDGAENNVAEALSIFAASSSFSSRTRGLLRVGERRWDVVMDREQRIMLPEANPVNALKKVIELNEAQDLLARDVAAIDFRNPRRPVLRLTTNAIEAMLDVQTNEAKEFFDQ
ncbi:MAG: cell division protein FtsQ/DivIB [Boseongicola sp.]